MTVGSVFSGIGGFDRGFEQAGCSLSWMVEREPFCQRVLARRFPGVPIHDDVTTATASLGRVDVLVGGFPCQDVSVAGKRAGLSGARSGLFFEFVRLAEELEPTWMVIENVPGLLTSHGGRDFHAVLATLAERGWRRAYRILDSRYFGVAQRRRRVFVVCHRGDAGVRAESVLFEPTGGRGDFAPRHQQRPGVAATLRGRSHGAGVNAPGRGGEDDANLVTIARPLKSGGNDRHDESHETYITGPLGGGNDGIGRRSEDDPNLVVAHALTGTMHKRHDTDTDTDTVIIASALSASAGHHGHSSPRGDGSDNLIAATLNSGGNQGGFRTEPGEHLIVFDERQITSPHNRSNPKHGDPVHTLHAAAPSVAQTNGVRRLTPLECERLQGFPDGWTCLCGVEPYTTKGCACPDSPRYKALGNAVTVSVAEWIGRRVMAATAAT